MGVGLHGTNGISPITAWDIYNTYVLPRYIYNLEVCILSKTQVNKLELFHRQTLRAIQGLPDRCSSAICYLLLGASPLESTLDMRVLLLLGRIADSKGSLLFNVSLRQLAVKDITSNSWLIYAVKLAGKYDLPSPHHLFDGSISPRHWKYLVKKVIPSYWFEQLTKDAASKSTLSFLDCSALSLKKAHPVWSNVFPNIRDITRARIKSKLLTGTYILQSNRAKFNKSEMDPTCILCGHETEDVVHFLTPCSALANTRRRFTSNLYSSMWSTLVQNQAALTHFILDSNAAVKEGIILPQDQQSWELYTGTLCFYLHVNRSSLLETLANTKAAPI